MKIRNARTWSCATALVAAMILAGCAGRGAEDQVGQSSQASDTFVIAVDGLTNSSDPQTFTGSGHRIAFDVIKAPLFEYVTFAENDGLVTSPENMRGFLAEEWNPVDGGLEVTLKDVKSSVGNPLTSEDVKWTFERIYGIEDSVAIGLAESAGLDPDEPVTVIDERTFRINADVNYLTTGILDGYQFFPFDSKTAIENSSEDDPWSTEYLSTHSANFGPYVISEFVPSESITYERNPNFDLYETAWDRIVLRHVPDAATRVSLLQAGEAQYIGQVGLASLNELKNDERATIKAEPFGGQDVIELTKTFEPFQDARVRKAVSFAIDREALAAGPYRGFAEPSTSIVSSSIKTENSTNEAFDYDPERARDLLAEAGYEDLEFTIYANQATMSGPTDSVLTALTQQLGDAGINVSIQLVTSPQDFRAGYADGKYEAWVRAEGPLQVDAQYLLKLYHHTDAASNFQAQSEPELDMAIDAAEPLSGDERQAAIAPGIQHFNDVMLNVPLVETKRVDVYSSSVCPGDRSLSFVLQPQHATPAPCE